MNTIETIRTRRSIRKYKKRPVPEKMMTELLRAAMSAPSAGNQQPWHFVIIGDRAILDEIPNIHPYAAMCHQAPSAILVCGDPSHEKHPGFWVQDCSAATMNLLLAAHDIGLGAVWVGIYPREDRVKDFRKLLRLPEQIIPLALVPIGYPAIKVAPEDRYKEKRVHYNGW